MANPLFLALSASDLGSSQSLSLDESCLKKNSSPSTLFPLDMRKAAHRIYKVTDIKIDLPLAYSICKAVQIWSKSKDETLYPYKDFDLYVKGEKLWVLLKGKDHFLGKGSHKRFYRCFEYRSLTPVAYSLHDCRPSTEIKILEQFAQEDKETCRILKLEAHKIFSKPDEKPQKVQIFKLDNPKALAKLFEGSSPKPRVRSASIDTLETAPVKSKQSFSSMVKNIAHAFFQTYPLPLKIDLNVLLRICDTLQTSDNPLNFFSDDDCLVLDEYILFKGSTYQKQNPQMTLMAGINYTTCQAIVAVVTKEDIAQKKVLSTFNPPFFSTRVSSGWFSMTNSAQELIIMELANQGSLKKLLRRHSFSKRQKLLISGDILHGVRSLHKKNIVHQDMKPPNILIHYDGVAPRAKIGDCGLSMSKEIIRDFRLEFSYVLGTPIFFSPEKFDSAIPFVQRNLSQASDVWAIGCTLYFLYFQRDPPWMEKILAEGSVFLSDRRASHKVSTWVQELFPEPENKNSMEHLIWEMLRPHQKERISIDQAAARVDEMLRRGFKPAIKPLVIPPKQESPRSTLSTESRDSEDPQSTSSRDTTPLRATSSRDTTPLREKTRKFLSPQVKKKD